MYCNSGVVHLLNGDVMEWVFALLFVGDGTATISNPEAYPTLEACLEERAAFIEQVGPRSLDYQVVCITQEKANVQK